MKNTGTHQETETNIYQQSDYSFYNLTAFLKGKNPTPESLLQG